ncbi:MAG TPA: hypothetical protein VGB37_11485 [Candidatus Lokiarchaeia archaeon]
MNEERCCLLSDCTTVNKCSCWNGDEYTLKECVRKSKFVNQKRNELKKKVLKFQHNNK